MGPVIRNALQLMLLACAFACLLLPGSARADDAALSALLAKLRAVDAVSAKFREEKTMALLATPLISEGVVHYQKPRSLVRHTQKPRARSLLLEGDKLSFGDASHVESASVAAQPALTVLVDAFIGVLSGDRAALEQAAKLTLETRQGDGWRIVVTPTRASLLKLVRLMEFQGVGEKLTHMRLVDANGDETKTTFSDIVLRKPFDAKERARLFRIGG